MFASPLFLIAAAAGAMVPLLLHLMQNRKRQTLPFPSLRFLKQAQKKSSRRIRIENALLWLVRTLIMLLLGLAFAMPILRSSGYAWLGDSPRDVALILDVSSSMGYQSGRETVWDKAVASARAVIEGLGDNDRFCVYLAREQPEAVLAELVGDKEQGFSRLTGIEPGLGSSQLAPAVDGALRALKKDARNHEQEVFIFTDNQALPWQSFAEREQKDVALLDSKTAFFVALLGASAPENAAPDSVEVFPPIVRPGSQARVTATLRHTGQTAETAVTLYVDGEQMGRRPVRLDGSDASVPTFHLPPLPAGVHVARLETPGDNLPLDDAFHFLIRVENQLPSLCVGSPEDTLFVRTALRAGAGPGSVAVSTISPERLPGENLGAYSCIFLCNALPLTGQSLSAMEAYAKGGGLVVVFPGAAAPATYQAWSCLPALPERIEEVPSSRRSHTLTWDQPRNDFLRALREGASSPALTIRRHLVFGEFQGESNRLLSMGPDKPFLLERESGAGRVLFFAVSADRSWSDFPLSPFFLPMVLQCVEYSAGFGERAPFLWAVDSLSLNERFPLVDRSTQLRDPAGEPVAIRSAVVDGRPVQVAENLSLPGVYLMSSAAQPVPTPALAVNLRREESDLTPIALEEVAARMGLPAGVQVQVAPDLEVLQRLIQEHRVGRTFGEELLWAALILILFEFTCANVLVKRGPRLSQQLHVDPSGSVKGHAAPARG